MDKGNKEFVLQALRGAITCEENSSESISNAVNQLIREFVKRNNLKPDQIISITFSVTKDLDACFPASIARQQTNWENIALLDCQQMEVKGDLKNCIRILALTWLPNEQTPKHTYLGNATMLRPDR
tara:strand:- start:1086 stop:1463 length:378 start_codon:yes stop_codon:yes gene_type:complete